MRSRPGSGPHGAKTLATFAQVVAASGREPDTQRKPCSSRVVATAGWGLRGLATSGESGATSLRTPGSPQATQRRPTTYAGSAADSSAGSWGTCGPSSGLTFAADLPNATERPTPAGPGFLLAIPLHFAIERAAHSKVSPGCDRGD